MTSTASIWAKLLLDRTEYNKGLNDAKSQTKDFTKSGKTGLGQLDEAFKSVTGQSLAAVTAWGVAAVAIKKVAQELAECEQAAVESAKADAKLNAVLESTGGLVGLTSDDLDKYATSLSKASGVDDELIKSAEAVMLTFTKIGEETFPQAMQAAADMAAVLGGDLQGKVTMIGKAMNDFSGYTALKRAGVSFTEEQIKQIANFKATNDLIGYQKLILGELSTEYGGAAKAINEAGDGQENLTIAWENYQEEAGKGMVTLKRQWNEFWTKIIESTTEAKVASNDYSDTLRELGLAATQYGWFKDGVKITKDQADAMIYAYNAAEVATDRYDEMSGAITAVGEAATATELQLEELQKQQESAISAGLTGKIKSSTEDYLSTILKLKEEQAKNTSNLEYWTAVVARAPGMVDELTAKMAAFAVEGDVNSQEYRTMQEELDKWKTTAEGGVGSIASLTTAVDENNTAQQEAYNTILETTRALIDQTLIAGLEGDELLNVSRALGIMSETDYAATIAAQQLRDEFDKGKISAEEMAGKTQELSTWIASLQSKNITITTEFIEIHKNVIEGNVWNGVTGVGAGTMGNRANGGMTVAGGLYHVNELGTPEILTVNNQDYLMMGSQSGVVTPLSGATSSGVSTSGGQGAITNDIDWRRVARIIGEEVKLVAGR